MAATNEFSHESDLLAFRTIAVEVVSFAELELDGNLSSISASIERSIPEKAVGWQARSPLFEIALVLVRLDHVASFIVNFVKVYGMHAVWLKQLVRSQ